VTKADFQAAIAEHAAAELLDATMLDPSTPALAQLRRGVESFLDHVAARPDAYVSLVRGAGNGDPALRAVSERTRAALVDRILARLGVELTEVPATVRLVVRGWVAASEEIVVTWLTGDLDLGRGTVVDLLVDGLLLPLALLLAPADAGRLLAP
jgi:AcrR family transcriptional regulator